MPGTSNLGVTKITMSNSHLQTQLQAVKRRWWILGIAAGLTWTLTVLILSLLLGGWLDLVWELSPEGRIGCVVASALIGVASLIAMLVHIGRSGQIFPLAKRVDQAMGFGGAVLTGCELEGTLQRHAAPQTNVSASLARMAVEHAAKLAGTIVPEKAVPAKQVHRSTIYLASLLCILGLLGVMMPEMMRTQWKRFAFPYSDVPQFSNTTIEIENPDKTVIYGEPLDIRAVVRGELVDSAVLVLENESGSVETLPMFPEQDSYWRANLAKVTENAVYYVRAYRARSTRHTISVITVPKIENVRFRVTPPSYTNRPAYEGPLPKEGISGLPRTIVKVWAKSNRPLSRGEISVTMKNDAGQNSQETGTTPDILKVEMTPETGNDSEVFGEFTVTGSGKFELLLFDISDQSSRDKFSGGITLLRDERPMIRIIRPPAHSLATASVVLPVVISAEDDYGISQVQLFRSLNDSRFLPSTIPLEALNSRSSSRRYNGQIDLPLNAYDLKPGDTIKLFARVEDNDPAGAKGSESTVALVEIISQENFEQMVRAKNAMELMFSRYREAQRRLEAAKEEVDRLQKKLDELSPNDLASNETRQELQELAQRMQQEAEAIRKLAQNPLPYDLDKELSKELEKAAKLAEEAAKSVEKMLDENNLNNESAKSQLNAIGQKLAGGKRSFDQATMPSLELLAAVLPLKRDENRFVMLVRQQKDLAERLASLKGRDKEDDPALKARMRELEEEQRQIRESLDTLLRDIEEHAKMLPEQEELAELREEALKFASDVRKSGAGTAMSEAEAGLAEYSGTIGHAKAQEAAEILEQFLSQCNGMGNCASKALGFRPGMGNSMNSTLEQLLNDMGFGGGTNGGLMGSGNGFGAQRGGANVGLYGMLPGMASFSDAQSGGQGNRQSRGMGGSSADSDYDMESGYETSAEGTVSGASEGAVPLRYRQAVGRYFQRIIEETDKNNNK